MAHDVTLRVADPTELDAVRAQLGLVFGFDPHPDDGPAFRDWLEWDRTIVADTGDGLVGTASTNSYRMAVPGGEVGAGGLTIVTVAPTHRRRGLLTAMMRRHLEDVRDRGEEVAILLASESSIYGRFGFGVGVETGRWELARAHGAFRPDVPSPLGSFRLLDPAAANAIVRRLWGEATAGTPGAVHPRDRDFADMVNDPAHHRDGATANRYLVYERDGEPQGYARYRQKEVWTGFVSDSKLIVREVQARDGEAYAALWRFLLDIDLIFTIDAYPQPVPAPLRLLLRDPRRLVETAHDGLWVRLVDVPGALAARRYAVSGTVVLEVRDDFFGSGGRFRLEGGPDGASCRPTKDAADVAIGVEHLGSVYPGGRSLGALAWLGFVTGDPAAVALADRMFRSAVPPRNALHF